jgi:hypothetical protein
MALEEYKDVIDEFCDAADIDDVASIFHTGLLKIGNIPVRLEYLEPVDQCRISVDLGMPAGGYKAGLYRLMLESNFNSGFDCVTTLGIEPVTGHAVLVVYVPLNRLQTDLHLIDLLGEQIDPVLEAWEALIAEVYAEEGDVARRTAMDRFI